MTDSGSTGYPATLPGSRNTLEKNALRKGVNYNTILRTPTYLIKNLQPSEIDNFRIEQDAPESLKLTTIQQVCDNDTVSKEHISGSSGSEDCPNPCTRLPKLINLESSISKPVSEEGDVHTGTLDTVPYLYEPSGAIDDNTDFDDSLTVIDGYSKGQSTLEERLKFLLDIRKQLSTAITINSDFLKTEELTRNTMMEPRDFDVIRQEIVYQKFQSNLVVSELRELFRCILKCNYEKIEKYKSMLKNCSDTSGRINKYIGRCIKRKENEITQLNSTLRIYDEELHDTLNPFPVSRVSSCSRASNVRS